MADHVFDKKSPMPAPVRSLYDWHARPGAFDRLVPPWDHIEVIEHRGGIGDGAVMRLRMHQGPVAVTMEHHHRDHVEGEQFVDVQVHGPFAAWAHTHRFVADGPDTSVLDDHIEYRLPLGGLGDLFGGGFAARTLERMFRFRHERTRRDLLRHQRHVAAAPLTVAITGASGSIGSHLAPFLTTGGHNVLRLVRREAGEGEVRWNPLEGEALPDGLAADAVVHLAAAHIGQRWTPARKRQFWSSRVDATRRLCEALAAQPTPPAVLVSASAIGLYGDRGDAVLDEDSAPGTGYLAELCAAWEAATEPARAAGIRVVNLRIGVVLSMRDGALQRLLPAFLAGVGGPIANGAQYTSWISLDDAVGVIHHVLLDDDLAGPVNATAPDPVTNRTLSSTLGRVLRRPSLLPVPAPAVRLAFGEMGEEVLLGGARVQPARLLDTGFAFEDPSLEGALRFELGRSS